MKKNKGFCIGSGKCVHAENNPKFAQTKARQAAAYSKIDPTFDLDIGRTAFMPEYAASNQEVKAFVTTAPLSLDSVVNK